MARTAARTTPEPARSRVDDRAALALLAHELLPAARRSRSRPLVRAVKQAVGAGDPPSLGRAPERLRRELLELIERHIARSRRGVAPRAVVAVTAAIMADSLAEPGAVRRWASPAR